MTKYDALAESIVSDLVRGIEAGADGAAWHAPWHFVAGAGDMWSPRNYATGNTYRGGNVVALAVAAIDRGYSRHQWATYKQWESVGAQVRRGESGVRLVRWVTGATRTDKATGERVPARPFPKVFSVFNIGQVDGIGAESESAAPIVHSDAAAIVAGAGADIRHGGNSAHYVPALDYVQLPERGQFFTEDHYWSTAFHELGHWTGHASRLARTFGAHGTDEYAIEELTAELCAAFLCAASGVSSEPRADHAEYLGHWVAVLSASPRVLFTVATAASRAAEFLTSRVGQGVTA